LKRIRAKDLVDHGGVAPRSDAGRGLKPISVKELRTTEAKSPRVPTRGAD